MIVRLYSLALLVSVLSGVVSAEDQVRKDLDQLRKDLDQLRKEKIADRAEIDALRKERAAAQTPIASVQTAVESKYGHLTPVTTKTGKLTLSGMVQVWYMAIENDNIGFFGDRQGSAASGVIGDVNEHRDNDTFSVRRAEIKFTMDLHEHIQAVVMFDPSRPVSGRPSPNAPVGLWATGAQTTTLEGGALEEPGFAAGLRMFQDAYIKYQGYVPYHDFTIGQFKPFIGEEGIRASSQLDFCERSMLGQLGDRRDLGLTVHGTWWDERFQYWLGVFNAAGDFFQTRAEQQNRPDDNDEKDLTWRLLLRPVWKQKSWGNLELGVSGQHGLHGEAGNPRVSTALGAGVLNVDGLNKRRTYANRWYAWMSYLPSGPAKGLWVRGEWAWIKDRAEPGSVSGFDATGFATNTASAYRAPNPFDVSGFYVAAGYKISESNWKDEAPGWIKPFEFAVRYEQFENILATDLVAPDQRTDTFASDVWTFGFNYYINGHHAKIQVNYHIVDDPDEGSTVNRTLAVPANRPRHFRGVDNNSLVVSFQVAW